MSRPPPRRQGASFLCSTLHVDVPNRHQPVAKYVHRRLRLPQDDVAKQGFLHFAIVLLSAHEDHLVGHRPKALDLDRHGPAGLATNDVAVDTPQLDSLGVLDGAEPLLPRSWEDERPTPVSTKRPQSMDLLSSAKLVILV